MSVIPFTDRELTRAWRELSISESLIASTPRKNPQRLLRFYAVECGLKAIWLKRRSRTLFNADDVSQTGHDLRKILKDLGVGQNLLLPTKFELSDVEDNGISRPRRFDKIGDLHQVWRYGGICQSPSDVECDDHLEKLLCWIQGELR